jgi:hypothetical protein
MKVALDGRSGKTLWKRFSWMDGKKRSSTGEEGEASQ